MHTQPLALTDKQKLYLAIMVNFMLPLEGMSTDIYLPSLPAINVYFNIDQALAQLTVTAYVTAMGISQLIAGPISDAYGRRPLLFFSVTTQLIAVLGILFSSTIYEMIFFRFLQGAGAAFMMVPARAIINDVFQGHELKKQFNYCTISFALGPIVAPFVGGYLQQYFGWQANFIFILVYISLVILLLLFMYKETQVNKRHFSLHHLWKNYHIILSNQRFLTCALFVGMAWGYGTLFNITGPFIVQNSLHYSAITYGHVALLMGLAYFLGNTSNRILFRYDEDLKTQLALWISFLTVITMLICTQAGILNLLTLIIPTFIIMFLSGFIFPIYVGECLIIFSDLAASANACLFSLIWLMFSGFTLIAILLKAQSLVPLAIAYSTVSIVSILFYYFVLLLITKKFKS